jgi:hypothetical protein
MVALSDHARRRGIPTVNSKGVDYPYEYDWGGHKYHRHILHEYLIDLRPDWTTVKTRMRKSIAEQARKAERFGVRYRVERDPGTHDELNRLVLEKRARKPDDSYDDYYLGFLTATVARRLSRTRLSSFHCAELGGKVVCVMQVLSFNKRAYALLLGADEDAYRSRAITFVQLQTIRNLKQTGVEWLNIAGAWEGSSLEFAKLSLGAKRAVCFGSTSPFLQGRLLNLLNQIAHDKIRWIANTRKFIGKHF